MIHFDIEADDLIRVGEEIGATPKQVKFAFTRALSRTAATLRKLSERGMRDELQLRTVRFIRLRLKSIKLRQSGIDGIGLWYGLNDVPVGELKGRPTKTAKGASFRGIEFPGGFPAKNKRGRPTIFKRKGAKSHPLIEAEMPIKDRMDIYVQDQVFDKTDSIFWNHFKRDLAARVKYQLGEK